MGMSDRFYLLLMVQPWVLFEKLLAGTVLLSHFPQEGQMLYLTISCIIFFQPLHNSYTMSLLNPRKQNNYASGFRNASHSIH